MSFDFTQFVNVLKLAPYVVQGIEQIHTEASSVTKTQLAQDALALAAGVAGAVAPGEEALIASASAGIATVISAISSVAGELKKAPSA